MRRRGSIMISLIAGVFFLVILTVLTIILLPKYTTLPGVDGSDNNSSENITSPIKQANSIADQVNLKSIETSLQIFFSEYGHYPNSSDELKSQGSLNEEINIANYSYQVCDSSAVEVVVFSTGGELGVNLNNGVSQQTSSQNCY